ncbi:MAG: NDP-sugar synthase [bacterium]
MTIKKALILAAGLGTRLRPVTETLPKSMVPIINRPIIEYIVELCARSGIEEAVINLHYFPDCIKDYFGHEYNGMKIQYSFEEELLENAGALANVEDFFSGEENLLVIASDNIADFDLQAMAKFHEERKALVTIATTTADDPSKYGVVETADDGKILQFQEKPSKEDACSDQVASCCYILSSEIFSYLPKGQKSHFGKEIFPVLLLENKPIYAFRHAGYWNDVGNPTNYRQSVHDLMDAKMVHPLAPVRQVDFVCDPESSISTTTLGKHTTIGPHCTVTNSHITESLLFSTSSIASSHLNNCIISKGCTITNCTLTNVVLGEDCHLDGVTLETVALWPKGTTKKVLS